MGLACFLLARVRGQHLLADGPPLERFLPPREGLLDLRVHGLHGWISAFSRWDAAPRARAGRMPGGRDSGPLLPLMKLPRIAYRKSIKPSQIIPPSRQPVHQPGATISPLGGDSCRTSSLGWAGLCSLLMLCSALLCPALPCVGFRAAACRGPSGDTSEKAQSLPRHRPELVRNAAHRNVIKLRPQWQSGGPHPLLLCRLQARLSGIPHQGPGAERLIGTPSSLRFCRHRFPSRRKVQQPRQLSPGTTQED